MFVPLRTPARARRPSAPASFLPWYKRLWYRRLARRERRGLQQTVNTAAWILMSILALGGAGWAIARILPAIGVTFAGPCFFC